MIYVPNIDSLILFNLAETRMDSSVLPIQMHSKVSRLIDGKTDLDKFSLEEKILILSSMGIQFYAITSKKDKVLGVKITRDLIPALADSMNHRQLSAVKRLVDGDMVVIKDIDVIKSLEAAYYLQNKRNILKSVRDYTNIRHSRFNNFLKKVEDNDIAINEMVGMIASFKLIESKLLIEGKFNQNQYIMLMKLWKDNSSLQKDIFKILSGSSKKKYEDAQFLEDRGLIVREKIQNKTTITIILTAGGRSLITNLIIKHL